MDPLIAVLLFAAGVAMGFINNLAGAGGAIAWVALVELGGLPDDAANVAMRPAALAIGLLGLLSFRASGKHPPRRAWLYGLAALPGALLGALLAVELPKLMHQCALLAVLLLLGWRLYGPRGGASAEGPVAAPRPLLGVSLFALAGLHMGFVQVGTGLVVMAALHTVHSRDLIAVNAAKMPVIVMSATVAVATLAWRAAIPWAEAVSVAVGAGTGSFLAARWSITKGSKAVSRVVLVVMVAALGWVAWQIRGTLAGG